MSSEALVGIGITIAELGVLGLLLGWAEQMRGLPRFAFLWLATGAVLVIVGLLITASGRFKTGSGTRADVVRSSVPDAGDTVGETEEQRY